MPFSSTRSSALVPFLYADMTWLNFAMLGISSHTRSHRLHRMYAARKAMTVQRWFWHLTEMLFRPDLVYSNSVD